MISVFLKTFATIFIAELGDKTQLTCMGYAATNTGSRMAIFLASTLALALSSALAVYFGCQVTRYVSPKTIKIAAGIVFIFFGLTYLRAAFLSTPPTPPAG